MPGDQFSFSVVVINKSSRNYSYQDKSLTVTLASNRTLANGWADDNFYNKLISFSPAKVNVNLPVLTNTLGSATDKTSSNYASLNSVFASALGTLKSGSESSSANAYMSLSAPGINNTYASVQFGASVDVTFSAEAEPIVLPDDPTPTGDKPVTPSDPTPTVTADTVTISDDDVPLASSPETGDTSVPLTVLAGICAASAVVLLATRRKKA
jgi:LPXTG-motif cell wall-anchored protein